MRRNKNILSNLMPKYVYSLDQLQVLDYWIIVELQQYQSAEGIISLLLCSKSQARSQRDEAELIGILGTLF